MRYFERIWSCRRGSALVGLCALTAVGCGGGNSQSVPFQGVVTLNGAPLADATVAITPTKATGPGPFVGTTDSAGKYSLGKVGDGRAGVEPGSYRVIITTVKPIPGADESTPPPTQKEIVPQQYTDGSIRVEVPEAGFENRTFDL